MTTLARTRATDPHAGGGYACWLQATLLAELADDRTLLAALDYAAARAWTTPGCDSLVERQQAHELRELCRELGLLD